MSAARSLSNADRSGPSNEGKKLERLQLADGSLLTARA
jgi:hypothetical protein